MIRKLSWLLVVFLVLSGCQKLFLGSDPPSSPVTNFESLWKTIDERYSFFSYKNIDWNEIHEKYRPRINDSLTDIQLFAVLFEMLAELRDAHVNLVSPFNVSRYEGVFTKSPENFDNRLIATNYLGDNYFITGPFKHQLIGSNEVGYIRYSSFSDEVSESDIDFVVDRFKDTKGIIIDVRSNGGGFVSGVIRICSRFADEQRHIYTSCLKNGPGHEDFAVPNEIYITPASTKYLKKVCILTNRGCYSATSFFVLAMRNFPNVTIVGDTTGGGLGAPTGAELPNGWGFRFSASRTLSPEGENFEDGIPPDVQVNLQTSDVAEGVDTIIEKAISLIKAD
jgi:hypothetical protein